MSGILEYSTTPSSNTAINGIGIAGSNSIKNGDDAMRQMMADTRAAVTNVANKTSGTYTAVKTDHAQLWRVTGNATINLTAAATLTAGWCLWVMADGGTATIDPSASEQVNGTATLAITTGNSALILCTGSEFRAVMFNKAFDAGTLGNASTKNVGTTAGTVAAGDDSRIDGAVQAAATDASGFGFVVDEDDMSSNSATKVPTQQSVKAYADSGDARQIGVGQTWQDVKSSRAPGTSYQNTTGRPIAVVVQYKSSVITKAFQVSSSGSAWINLSDTDSSTEIVVSVIVPAGWYYRLESSTTVYYWAELK